MRTLKSRRSAGPETVVSAKRRSRPVRVAILTLTIISLLWVEVQMVSPMSAGSSPPYPLAYAGVNYYDPSEYYTGCPSYTYLQVSCWNNPAHAITPRQQLISDLKFVSSQHIVGTMSVTISLDQILQWNNQTGATGFQPGTLANVDDMLSLFHQYGVKALLILYVYEQPGADNEFKPEAIDGNHAQMEANYLQAEYQFIQHLAANPVDVASAPVIDLQDEAYYQFEVYFKNPKNLGAYKHTCLSNSGVVDTGCVDTKIAYPWLTKLYQTAKSASNRFLYTISDTHRLFEDYKYWINLYPVDVIDEHVYDSKPWADASMYQQARHWGKPWFVGEAGCDSYSDCTYNPVEAAPVDKWWLQNLGKVGALSVFVEDKHTAWTYGSGGWDDPQPTQVGLELQNALANVQPTPNPTKGDPIPTPTPQPTKPPAVACPSGATAQGFADRFDAAHAGNVRTSYSADHFNGSSGPSNLEIESFLSYSKPNALAVRVPHGGSAYLYRSFQKSHLGCRLQFQFVLGHGFSLAKNNYMVLAETRTGSASNTSTGRVQLVL
jgi:hypothetical protein